MKLHTATITLLTLSFSLVLGCSTATEGGPDNDAAVVGGDDAFVVGSDAFVAADDAFVPPDDAGDPLDFPARCTSGRNWVFGNLGSAFMNPGLACINCHQTERRAPQFTAAGTVYPSGHEPDRCVATGETSATVEITDATGAVVSVAVNSSGNFYYQGALALPITASVHYMGRTRDMITPANSGDCNSCHTQNGDMAAPGRITLP